MKRRELLAAAALPTQDHAGLAGSHREEIQRIYLREILPRRFEVGRGIVYGFAHRSREADIVIWDAENFPSLPMADHSFFFAESVRVVLESKSRWSWQAFDEVREKSRSIRDIITTTGPSLADELEMIRLDIASLKSGRAHEGMMIAKHHIGTAALFLRGGRKAFQAAEIPEHVLDDVDDAWPDLVLLLDPGHLVVKEYPSNGGEGYLLFYELGEDALLAFTNGLLALLSERSVQTEEPLYLTRYVFELAEEPPQQIFRFKLLRLPAQRMPLWR